MVAVTGEDLWLGLAVALAAAGCYEISYVVQALEARAVGRGRGPRPSLLLQLALRPRWAAAIVLAIAGFGLQIVALGLAPLTLVQPAVASGLLLLFYLGVRVLGERVTRRDVAAAIGIVAGIAGIAAAAPDRAESVSSPVALALVLGGLGLVALAPYALRSTRGALLVASAGAADAAAVFAAKLVSNALSEGRPLAAAALAAGAGATVLLGLMSETAALQRLPATRVAPLVLVIQTAVPVLLAPLLLGEDWGATPLGGAVIAGSLGLLVVGTLALAASRALGLLLTPVDALEHQGGGGGKLRE
jgi:drug/metabolite transporter (DMT)-like permease